MPPSSRFNFVESMSLGAGCFCNSELISPMSLSFRWPLCRYSATNGLAISASLVTYINRACSSCELCSYAALAASKSSWAPPSAMKVIEKKQRPVRDSLRFISTATPSDRSAALACAKLNTLRKRQLARKIHGVRLAAHVALPAIAPSFASTAGVLFPAERAADFRPAGTSIHIRDPAIASGCAHESFRFAHVICENRRGQSLWHTVLDRDRFVEIAIGQQVKQRTKGFVFHDLKIRFGTCQTRFHITTAGNSESISAVKDFAAFIFQSLDRFLNCLNRAFIDERSHHSLAIERISDWQTLVSSKQFIPNFRRNRLVHDYAPCGSATLSGRAYSAKKDRLGRHIDVGA